MKYRTFGHKTVEMGLDAAEALRTQEGLRQRSAAAATDAVVSEVHCLLSYNMCCDCWAYGGNTDVQEAKALVNLTDARSACTVTASFETTTCCQIAVHEATQILHPSRCWVNFQKQPASNVALLQCFQGLKLEMSRQLRTFRADLNGLQWGPIGSPRSQSRTCLLCMAPAR